MNLISFVMGDHVTKQFNSLFGAQVLDQTTYLIVRRNFFTSYMEELRLKLTLRAERAWRIQQA